MKKTVTVRGVKYWRSASELKRAKAAADERRMDRLACKIVSIVAHQMTGDKLYAYGGIEASRAVRKLLLRTFKTKGAA